MKKIEFQIYPDGSQFWCLNEKYSREDGPAAITTNGTQFWFLNGGLHREDGPAVIYLDGSQYWYLNDMFIKGNRDEEDSV